MKTGVSNNNNNNKHYSDKFQVIESISERNNNNSSPSIDILSYSNISNISNNNVYADIADLDGTETHSLMYSQNVSQQPPQQQWGRHDRALSSSSRRQLDDPSFYVTNSTSRSVHSSYGKNIWIKIHLSLSLSVLFCFNYQFFSLIIFNFSLVICYAAASSFKWTSPFIFNYSTPIPTPRISFFSASIWTEDFLSSLFNFEFSSSPGWWRNG